MRILQASSLGTGRARVLVRRCASDPERSSSLLLVFSCSRCARSPPLVAAVRAGFFFLPLSKYKRFFQNVGYCSRTCVAVFFFSSTLDTIQDYRTAGDRRQSSSPRHQAPRRVPVFLFMYMWKATHAPHFSLLRRAIRNFSSRGLCFGGAGVVLNNGERVPEL